jgi:hypothetical protein
VPDIWLSGLVAALGAMARAPAPSREVTEACRRHLGVLPDLAGAPETAPASPNSATTPPEPPRRALETVH